jgi:diguanylate cyclase (GGDEF)-like protein
MENFNGLLFEAVLVAYGKVLAKYNVFAEGEIMRDIGKEILEYLNKHGLGFVEKSAVEDISNLTDLFVKNGFAESLDITPADRGEKYVWKNLYGMQAYKELYELALNPFLSCPLNTCLYYLAGKYKKKMLMHRKEFRMDEGITEAQYELVDDDGVDNGRLDELVIESATLYEIAFEREKLYRHQAITDALTGLNNRRYILDEGNKVFAYTQEHQVSLSVLMMDIDFFKHVNDEFGHRTGDIVLRTVASICQKKVRDIDLVGRYGGEEFVIILPFTPQFGAVELAERLREEIENTTLKAVNGARFRITVSIGVTCCEQPCDSFETVLQNADTALYKAKNLGRNQVVVFD